MGVEVGWPSKKRSAFIVTRSSVCQLRRGYVWEATEVDEVVELAMACRLRVIAAENHIECVTLGRRERDGIHQRVGCPDVDASDRRAYVGIGA